MFIHRSVQRMDIIMSFWQYGGRRRSYRCCESRNPAEHTLLHQDVVWCLGPHRVSPKPYHWSVFFGNLVLLPGTLRLSRFCGVDVLYSPFHLHNPQTDRPLGQIQNVLDLTTSHHSLVAYGLAVIGFFIGSILALTCANKATGAGTAAAVFALVTLAVFVVELFFAAKAFRSPAHEAQQQAPKYDPEPVGVV